MASSRPGLFAAAGWASMWISLICSTRSGVEPGEHTGMHRILAEDERVAPTIEARTEPATAGADRKGAGAYLGRAEHQPCRQPTPLARTPYLRATNAYGGGWRAAAGGGGASNGR